MDKRVRMRWTYGVEEDHAFFGQTGVGLVNAGVEIVPPYFSYF